MSTTTAGARSSSTSARQGRRRHVASGDREHADLAQAGVPASVDQQAHHAEGRASAVSLACSGLGGRLGSFRPGRAWERWGWPGVLACCSGAVAVGIAANALRSAGLEPRRVAGAGGC